MQQRKAYQRVNVELSQSHRSAIAIDNNSESESNNDGEELEIITDGNTHHFNNSTPSPHHQKRSQKLALSFWIAGLLNNAGYVIMIAAAKSISEGGVGLVFLANILPALLIKASAPYWFEMVPYVTRMVTATLLMVGSFLFVAMSSSLSWQLFGVALTSAQGSLGEASLLALAGRIDGELALVEFAMKRTKKQQQHHKNDENCDNDSSSTATAHEQEQPKSKGLCLNSFSSGTGFAGVFGFFWVWFFSQFLGLDLSLTLLLAIGLAVGYLASYRSITRLHNQPQQDLAYATIPSMGGYSDKPNSRDNTTTNNASCGEKHQYQDEHDNFEDEGLSSESLQAISNANNGGSSNNAADASSTTPTTAVREIATMNGLERFYLVCTLWPYFVPLFTVYVAEYTLQSGTWTAIGFPVTDQASRDRFYQFSNWLYQVGVFLSRSSGGCFVAPMALLWAMPVLQCTNVVVYWGVAASQGTPSANAFLDSSYFLYPAALYAGLLGGAVYVHGYLRICRDLPLEHREFALSATSLAECLGIVVADVLGLAIQACLYQIHGLEGAAMACPRNK